MNSHNGYYVSYDKDGNITSVVLDGARRTLKYDSTNKLISAGQNAYTYNAENVRVKNLCGGIETSYVYDTNAKLSKLLVKKTGTTVTKYIYGRGLIGEETSGTFRTYHFDYRGSTVALTNINGTITDTFEYDTYGKLISRTGSTKILFMYNGRDGVVTDDNGLIYMRARYYSPELRRFVNADIIAGDITEAITLNRYAYANGNPVSNVDPLGLSADARTEKGNWWNDNGSDIVHGILDLAGFIPVYGAIADGINAIVYAVEGDWGNAALSAFCAIPAIGDIAGGVKWIGKLFKGANRIIDGIGWLGKLFKKTDDIVDITKAVSSGTEAIGEISELTIKISSQTPNVIDAANSIYKSSDIGSVIKSSTGSYEIIYKNGYNYIGKGGFNRAMTSAKQHATNLDDIASINWKSAPNNKQAFIDEYLRQKEFGGVLSSNPDLPTYNKIWSPGKKYYGD